MMSGRMNGSNINIGGNNGNYFFIDWQVASQSIENNSTVINWQSYFHYNSADAQLDNGIVGLSGTRWSNGGRVKNFTADYRTRDVPIASGSITIGHNSDGTQSIAVSGGIDVYMSGRSSGAQTWALPTIPRNSQVSTNKTSYTLGEAITINTNRRSSSFTHTITLRQNNGSGTVLKTFNSIGSSVTWTPTSGEIEDMEELIPNSNTFVLHITQRNNQVGANSTLVRNLTLTNANPTFSDFDFRDSDSATVAITGDDQILVKGKSTLEVEIDSSDKMVAIKSATPDRYDIVYDGVIEEEAYSASDVTQTFSPISTIGTRAIIVRAYDSRGNSTTVAKSIQVYDYTEPNIEIDISRENNFGENVTIKTNGTFDLLPIGGVDKNELTAGSLEYRYKELPSGSFGSWVDIDFTVTDNEFEGEDDFVSLDNGKSFEFEFRISDKFGTVTQTATLGAGVPLMFIGENGTFRVGEKTVVVTEGWQSWTPTLTQINAVSMNCEYLDMGDFYLINAEIVVDSIGGNFMAMTLPFLPKTYNSQRDLVTGVTFYDASAGATGVYYGTGALANTAPLGNIRFQVPRGATAVTSSSATVPFTWASGDKIVINTMIRKA